MNSTFSAALEIVVRTISGIRRRCRDNDAGMSTAEYAVGTVAAVAFAVVLYKVVRSDAVSSALSGIIRSALHAI
jgi:hypothetical protein